MRREFPDEHDEPWSEEEWLADMKRNDARADRFGELLETLRDDPNREEVIAREMGWGRLAAQNNDDTDADDDTPEDDDEQWSESKFDPAEFMSDEATEDEDLDDESEPSDVRLSEKLAEAMEKIGIHKDQKQDEEDEERIFSRHRESSREIAEFKLTNRVGMKIQRLLDPYGQGEDDPTDGLFGEALIGAHIASAKIVGGHSLGYGKHYINGNIARQRIGLDAVDKSIKAFQQLKKDKFLPGKLVDVILPDRRAFAKRWPNASSECAKGRAGCMGRNEPPAGRIAQ
jgi:hypothetical protein